MGGQSLKSNRGLLKSKLFVAVASEGSAMPSHAKFYFEGCAIYIGCMRNKLMIAEAYFRLNQSNMHFLLKMAVEARPHQGA